MPSASSPSSTEPFPSFDDAVAPLSKSKHLVPSLATLSTEGKATAKPAIEDVNRHGNSCDASDSENAATHFTTVQANPSIIPPSSWYPPTPLPWSLSSPSTSSAVVARPPRLRKDFRFDLARVALSLASATAEASTPSSASTSSSAAYASLMGRGKNGNGNGSASGKKGMDGMRRWSGGLGLGLGLGMGSSGSRAHAEGEDEDDDAETTPDPPPKSELRRLGVGGYEGPGFGVLGSEGRSNGGRSGKGSEEGRDGIEDTGRTTNTGSAPRTVNGSGRITATAVTGPSEPLVGRGPHHLNQGHAQGPWRLDTATRPLATVTMAESSTQSCRVRRGYYSTPPSSSTADTNPNFLDLARDLEVPVDLLQLIEHDILELLDAQPDVGAAGRQGHDVGMRDGHVRRLASSSFDLAGASDAVEELESCAASIIGVEDTDDVDERAGNPTDESRQRWRGLAYQQVRQRETSRSRSRSTSSSPTAPSTEGAASTAATGFSSIRSLALVPEEVEEKEAEALVPLFEASETSSPPDPSSPSPPQLPPAPSPTPNTTPCSPLSPAPSLAGSNRLPMASPSASPRPTSLPPSPLLPSLYGTARVRRVASQRSLRKTALLQAVLAEMAGPLAEEAGEERMARARLLRRALVARAAANPDAGADAGAASNDGGSTESGGRTARARGSWEGLGSVGGWVYL